MTGSDACCSHSKVVYRCAPVLHNLPYRACFDVWECVDCKQRFYPMSEAEFLSFHKAKPNDRQTMKDLLDV